MFTVLSLLPTLGDQILNDMNIEKDWAKLQESRKLEKVEIRLKKEREEAALLREEHEAMEQLKDDTVNESVVIIEADPDQPKAQLDSAEGTQEDKSELVEKSLVQEKDNEEETPKTQMLKSAQFKSQGLDSSVGSLSNSFNVEEDRPLPAGILNKKEKHLLWEEIKTKSNVSKYVVYRVSNLIELITRFHAYIYLHLFRYTSNLIDTYSIELAWSIYIYLVSFGSK